jgi:hypothetical protein
MTTTPPPSGIQEPDPPDVRLTIRAGIAILSRIIDRPDMSMDDLSRVVAYLRALRRLDRHLEDLER